MGLNPKDMLLLLATVLNLVSPIRTFEEDGNLAYFVNYNNTGKKFSESPENRTIRFDKRLKACDCGWRNFAVSSATKIVGGHATGINEFPAMAGLLNINTGLLYCGCTIISDRYLLTAGHCVSNYNASSLAILVGDHNISSSTDTKYSAIYFINAYEIHPSYAHKIYENDIAILQTKTRITFNAAVGPICLPFKYSSTSFSNKPVEIVGWGQIEFSGPTSDVLLKATLKVLSNAQCAVAQQETISAGEICTYSYGKDSCQSDSGGPILWTGTSTNRMYIVGIISHGVGCASIYPGINTRVTNYLDWIVSRTRDVTYCYK